MSEPLLRPFVQGDAVKIVNRDGVQVDAATICWQAAQGPAFTVVVEDQPIGCAGVLLPWPGVGQCWMVLGTEIEAHTLWMYRHVRHILDGLVQSMSLHRLEAVALVDEPRNLRWLEGLGFRVEQDGIARKLLPDQRSMRRYEWIKGD